MTTKQQSATESLRSQLVAIDGHKVELLAERDELSYLALIDKQPQAIKRLQVINEEIRNLTVQAETIESALKEAHRREAAADDADFARRRRADAEKAGVLMAEAERIAEAMDGAMRDLQKHAVEYQRVMADVRRLSGSGPQHEHLGALLSRAIKAGLAGVPQFEGVLQPHERRSVADITGSWGTQVRNKINSVIDAAKQAA
jgi:hypothetical protein